MAHFSRFVHVASALLAASSLAGCGGERERKPDRTPPEFEGLQTAVAQTAGTAVLTWSAASDRSLPITYGVWVANSSGEQPLNAAPIAETADLQVTITGLPTGAAESWFVVRATDAEGNRDLNEVEMQVVFGENHLALEGRYETPIASDIAVSSSGDVVAMGGFISDPQVRAWLFDTTDPAEPALVSTILGPGRSTDVEIRGDILWVSTEDDPTEPGDGGPDGVHAYDISDPANPVPLVSYGDAAEGMRHCHTIWLDGAILYCASTEDGLIHLVDVSDPAAPQHLSSVGIPDAQVHDMYVAGDIAAGFFLSDGWAFFDVSDPMNPVLQQQVPYANAFTHNGWPTADGDYLYTTDENLNGHLRIWDIRDRDAVVQVGEYFADSGQAPRALVHNVQIVGNRAYVAWYEAGVHVLDVTIPTDPVLIGYYDTYPGQTTGFYSGAWGVAPFPPYVYVSDLDSGLYVLRLDE